MSSKHAEGTYGWHKEMNYDPRFGDNGRVGKDEFSIDGKSWAYRDPQRYNAKSRDASKSMGDDDYNEHSHAYSNPLYHYSYGEARDAAKALGIGNVSNKEEADRIIDYIQNGPKQAEPSAPIKEVKEKKVDAKPADPVPPSQEITEAKERAEAFAAEMRGDRFNIYGLKKSPYAERSSEIYNPNQGFQVNQQTTVSTNGNQQAQSFMQSKLNKAKNDFNFQPML